MVNTIWFGLCLVLLCTSIIFAAVDPSVLHIITVALWLANVIFAIDRINRNDDKFNTFWTAMNIIAILTIVGDIVNIVSKINS